MDAVRDQEHHLQRRRVGECVTGVRSVLTSNNNRCALKLAEVLRGRRWIEIGTGS